MIDEEKLNALREKYSRSVPAASLVEEMPEIMESLERLLAVKRAADPFVAFSHDPTYWQQRGEEAYENLKQAMYACTLERKPPITKLEFLD